MEPIQTGAGLISGGTGISIQVIVAVVGGAITFGVGALIWIDKRITGAADKLGDQILALDERYRNDHLDVISRVVRLESQPPQQHWSNRGHAVNGQ